MKKDMNHNTQMIGLAIFVSLSLTGITFSYLHFFPIHGQSFFVLTTLDQNMGTSAYYSNNLGIVHQNEILNWHITVYNHMFRAELIEIRIKLVNSSVFDPNLSNNTPSPVSPLLVYEYMLNSNETWVIPVAWSIGNVTKIDNGNATAIEKILFNGKILQTAITNGVNEFYRWIFELWVFDESSMQFSFTWKSGAVNFSSANIMIFEVR
jgi:hypothetical protein